MDFNTEDVQISTGFKPGVNASRVVSADYTSSRSDGEGPKHLIISIPDSFVKQIIWSPKQEGEGRPMPFNKYTFENGVVVKKGEEMSPKQANEFEMANYMRDVTKLLKAACGEDAVAKGKNFDEFVSNVAKQIDGKKLDVKLVYDKPSTSNGKYYLGFAKKNWYAVAGSKELILSADEAHLIQKVRELSENPPAEMTSAPKEVEADDLPFG